MWAVLVALQWPWAQDRALGFEQLTKGRGHLVQVVINPIGANNYTAAELRKGITGAWFSLWVSLLGLARCRTEVQPWRVGEPCIDPKLQAVVILTRHTRVVLVQHHRLNKIHTTWLSLDWGRCRNNAAISKALTFNCSYETTSSSSTCAVALHLCYLAIWQELLEKIRA